MRKVTLGRGVGREGLHTGITHNGEELEVHLTWDEHARNRQLGSKSQHGDPG